MTNTVGAERRGDSLATKALMTIYLNTNASLFNQRCVFTPRIPLVFLSYRT